MPDLTTLATTNGVVFSSAIPDPVGIVRLLSTQRTAARSMQNLLGSIARRDAKTLENPRGRLQTFPTSDQPLQNALALINQRLALILGQPVS